MNVLGAGLITADILALCDASWHVKNSPAYFGGGTVCNILSHLAWNGWECAVLGGLGDDELGPIVSGDLARMGVDTTGLLIMDGEITRRIGHMISIEGESKGKHRFDESCYACGSIYPPFPVLDFEVVRHVAERVIRPRTILLVDRANPLTLALARMAKSAGGLVVFEPGYLSRNRRVVEELIDIVDLLKYSTELKWDDVPFRRSPLARPKHANLIIETRGRTGVRALHGNREIRLTTTPIMEIVDSAGAGDAFMAGLLTGLGEDALFDMETLSESSLESALERGQAFGGLTCLFAGAKGIMHAHSRSDVESAIVETIKTRRPPDGFAGGSTIAGGYELDPPDAKGICPVCRLWIPPNGPARDPTDSWL